MVTEIKNQGAFIRAYFQSEVHRGIAVSVRFYERSINIQDPWAHKEYCRVFDASAEELNARGELPNDERGQLLHRLVAGRVILKKGYSCLLVFIVSFWTVIGYQVAPGFDLAAVYYILIGAAAGTVAGLVFMFWSNHIISKKVAPAYAREREKAFSQELREGRFYSSKAS